MSHLPVTVEKSCAGHPYVRHGPLPRHAHIRVNARRLFSLGSIILQNATVGRKSYANTRSLWRSLYNLYIVYLRFSSNQIVAHARGEDLTKLSEIVGVGCGLAAMSSQFAININRFRRFIPSGKTKRVDFEFYSQNQRFFHETKGTTYITHLSEIRKDIRGQKSATRIHCRKRANGPRLTACTASITAYQHSSRTSFNSNVILLDPPADDNDTGREAREADELSSILRYYRNFYLVTHIGSINSRLSLGGWLADVIRDLDDGRPAPRQSPTGLITNGRIREPSDNESPYSGTIFDARIADRAIISYRTFKEASEAIKEPVIFLGVSDEVTRLIVSCKWNKLLEYNEPNSTSEDDDSDTRDVLESGILSKVLPYDEEIENMSQNIFSELRYRAELQGSALP